MNQTAHNQPGLCQPTGVECAKRAILSVPAHKPQWLESARASGAWVMWDLEDGVPDEHKDAARENVRFLAEPGDLVRVNSGERYEEDMEAVSITGSWVVAPKVGADILMRECEGIIIESAAAVQNVDIILETRKPLVVLFGWVDLLAETGLTPASWPFVDACRERVVLACRARGIPVYDGPPLDDAPAEADRARMQGFDGMGCIHPSQVPDVVEAFASTADFGNRNFLRQIEVYGDAVPKPLREIAGRCK